MPLNQRALNDPFLRLKLGKAALDRRHLGFAALNEAGRLDEARIQSFALGIELDDVRLDRISLWRVIIELMTL